MQVEEHPAIPAEDRRIMSDIRQALQSSVTDGAACNPAAQLLPDPRSPSVKAAALQIASLLRQAEVDSRSVPSDQSHSHSTDTILIDNIDTALLENCCSTASAQTPASSSGTKAPAVPVGIRPLAVRQGFGRDSGPKQAPSDSSVDAARADTCADMCPSTSNTERGWIGAVSREEESKLVARLFKARDSHVTGDAEGADVGGCSRKPQKQRTPWSIKVWHALGPGICVSVHVRSLRGSPTGGSWDLATSFAFITF